MVIFSLVIIALFSGCKKESENTIQGEGIRLKYMSGPGAVTAAVSGMVPGYQVRGEPSFTDIGNYPALPHIYYYSMGWEKELADEVFDIRFVSAQAGTGDDSKEEVLQSYPDYVEINDGRLGKSPYSNAYALKSIDFSKKEWHYIMILNLDHINQDNQVISISGQYYPNDDEYEALAPEPPTTANAISIMLNLTEPIE